MEMKKSSDEIITELFDSINSVNASETDPSDSEDTDSKKSSKKEIKKMKKSKKNKKSKNDETLKIKKHKKKKKKRKKHKRNLSVSEASDNGRSSKKRKLKKKSSKHKRKDLEKRLVSDEPIANLNLTNNINDENVPEKNVSEIFTIGEKSEMSTIPLPPNMKINCKTSESIPTINESSYKTDLSVNSLKVADVFVEDLIESCDKKAVKSIVNPSEKPKMAIKISDLRHSTVLEQAKLKADLHEEGEILESSSNNSEDVFRNGKDNGAEPMVSSRSLGSTTLLERRVESSSQSFENFFLEIPSDLFYTIREDIKERKLDKKVPDELKDDRSRLPENLTHKRKTPDSHECDELQEKKKFDSEVAGSRNRSREKKALRSRSKDKRSRSRSRVHHHSRTKDNKRSRSSEKNRSKDSDNKESKKHKDKLGQELGEVTHDSSRKNDDLADNGKNFRRSKSKERKRESSRSKESSKKKRGKKTPERRGRSRDRHSKRSRSSRSRSRSKHKGEYFIDKSKLLEIARKNALNMIKQGQVNMGVNSGIPGAVGVSGDVNKVAAITAGGKTVDELTDFCKLLSQKEATGQESVSSESSSDNENERPFHHPFQLKERPNNIIMNIRNCASLPVKTHQEKTTENAQQLRLQFPVSSGQQHRKTESEWVPVSSTKNEPKAIMPPPPLPKCEAPVLTVEKEKLVQPQFVPLPPPPPPPPPVFVDHSMQHHTNNFDLGNMITERLSEIRHQYEASNQSYHQINCWPGMENQAGLFTGSTGARVLTAAELASGQQAWAKKDQLICAQPVSGGMGMSLLQKMGWKPGEGLGKHNEGSLEPLKLPVKMDKRGLVCAEELPRRHRMFPPPPPKDVPPVVKSLEGKHPVSLLVEYCSRRHFPPPVFTVISEEGPAHKKNFVFKVTVNGFDYQPANPSPNKKQAKSEAATLCLKSLNILPTVVSLGS